MMSNEELVKKMTSFLENGGMVGIFIIAIFGIICAFIGHIGSMILAGTFSWVLCLCLDVPLAVFSIWAMGAAWKIWNKFNK